jgi:PAS domain S-box-containing protein
MEAVPERLRILLVEDNEDDALFLLHRLRHGGVFAPEMTRVDTAARLAEALTKGPWDIVISDWHMPQIGGLQAFELVKAHDLEVPFLFLSGAIGEEPVVEAMKAGADNFLLKDRLAALIPTIQRELVEAEGRRRRRRAEEALKASELRFRAIWEGVQDAIVIADADGRVVMFNRAAEQMFGHSREEIVGGSVLRLVPSERREVSTQALTQTIAIDRGAGGAGARTTEFSGQRRDGTVFPVEMSLTTWSEEGQPRYTGVLRDISERRRAEEMRIARDVAEAASRTKAEFLANMSHEIRTPLNAIIGMSGLLGDTPLSDLQREFVETIRISGDHLITVINDILDYSKLESGQFEIEREAFELRACVEGALDLVAGGVAEKGLELAYVEDPRVPEALLGDPARLRQVLVNLLSNAVKFTERGEVVVEWSMLRTVDATCEVRVAVRDTGIGIEADRLHRLFVPFSQVDASTTRVYGGTGLGLTICKQIVEAMGGRIGVDTTPGVGSTFWFTFLAAAAAAGEDAGEPTSRSSGLELRGRRVLIVDDNATHRRILRLQAEAWGMRPFDTGSPMAALEQLRTGVEYELALVDHRMPEMDGIELAREIRRLRGASALPLVVMTSVGSLRRLVDSSGIEVQGILTKPLRKAQLQATLVAALDRRAATTRQRPRAPDPAPDALVPGLRILLTEDNLFNQRVAILMLGKMGLKADLVTNGRDAITALERQVYDVVLMDMLMPVMDGMAASREIRARLPPERQPRIIALTANALADDRERCIAAGMDDYLSKPVDQRELRRVLGDCRVLAG